MGTITTKVGVENYLTGKCLQGASRVVRGVGRSLNNVDQTTKEIKIAHGLSGAPMPKPSAAKPQIVKTIPKGPSSNPYRTFSSPQAAGDVAHVSQAPTLQPIPATSSTSSSISVRFAPIVQAGKKFFAEPQPGYIDLSPSDVIKVNNMKEFFQTNFGQILKGKIQKTNYTFQGQSIYQISEKVKHSDFKKGDYFYLDGLHKDHLEVFTKNKSLKGVYNLDGLLNSNKTKRTFDEGRIFPI